MDKFHVGQMVRVVKTHVPKMVPIGSIVTIVSPRRKGTGVFSGPGLFYEISAKSPLGDFLLAREENLAPVYDGDQPVSWSECAWKPAKRPTPAGAR